MEMLKKYNKIIIGSVLVVAIVLISFIYSLNDPSNSSGSLVLADSTTTTIPTTTKSASFYVDIKGAVKKPGVYKAQTGDIVQDIITKAGGLKSSASTNNINLAEQVKEAMVIYVFTKNELKTTESTPITNATCTTNVIEVNKCPTITTINNVTTTSSSSKTTEASNKLININTASKEELMSIPNIGSSKADSIIIYRTEHPFKTIEDIMNVSGIGESIYVKIKDHITV